MKLLPSNYLLMKKYILNEKELFKIMNNCIKYFLSEEELVEFVNKYYFKLEMKLNKRYQR